MPVAAGQCSSREGRSFASLHAVWHVPDRNRHATGRMGGGVGPVTYASQLWGPDSLSSFYFDSRCLIERYHRKLGDDRQREDARENGSDQQPDLAYILSSVTDPACD